jgi:hypothetical protein
MPEIVLLDSGPLGFASGRPGSSAPDRCRLWIRSLRARQVEIIVPVADYEVRRELTRVRAFASLQRQVIVVTMNVGHLARYCDARLWTSIT